MAEEVIFTSTRNNSPY